MRIWGGIPMRNPDFTGRETLLSNLRKALETRSAASVLPQTLHGMGGVGKTQLAVEFVYRYADQYDVVWWISAEQQSLVLQSLLDLSRRLGLPQTEDLRQAATMVIDALASTRLRWLLVYDNALDPDDITGLVPSAGGHVILTSRNQTWANVWDAIEVDIFDRPESVELIRKRGNEIARADAERLAETLGDLPLALDQAASWQSATGMPVDEYLSLFDQHVQELLSEGRPANYPTTVAAFVNLAFDRLRVDAPAVAQLLELFAFLGAEPLSVSLLRAAKNADISQPLRGVLRDSIKLSRTIRALRQYGLAKVSGDQSIQVHRLVQLVVRDGLSEDRSEQSRRNVHAILSAANPADPDADGEWQTYAQLNPHILPSHLIVSDERDAHQAVIDQIRYLYVVGDSEAPAGSASRQWRPGGRTAPRRTWARTASSRCLPRACWPPRCARSASSSEPAGSSRTRSSASRRTRSSGHCTSTRSSPWPTSRRTPHRRRIQGVTGIGRRVAPAAHQRLRRRRSQDDPGVEQSCGEPPDAEQLQRGVHGGRRGRLRLPGKHGREQLTDAVRADQPRA